MSEFDDNTGLDELDSGNFRFPTPPPPEMLLKEDCSSGSDEDHGNDHGVVPNVGNTDEPDMANKKLSSASTILISMQITTTFMER